jgi:hypothetical protein
MAGSVAWIGSKAKGFEPADRGKTLGKVLFIPFVELKALIFAGNTCLSKTNKLNSEDVPKYNKFFSR